MTYLARPTLPPFDTHPALWGIWPEPYASEAAAASNADYADRDEPVFLIMCDGLEDEYVVGITGLFFMKEDEGIVDPTAVHLRWTGILPNWRRSNIAKRAMLQLRWYCKDHMPERTKLIELCPLNDYGATVAPFFERVGFTKGNTVTYYGEPWVEYVYDLTQ